MQGFQKYSQNTIFPKRPLETSENLFYGKSCLKWSRLVLHRCRQRACNKEEHYALALFKTIFGNSNHEGYQEKIMLLFTDVTNSLVNIQEKFSFFC